MGRVTKVVEHLGVQEIDARLKQETQAGRLRRWQVIRCALGHPRSAAAIARGVGLARPAVHNWVAADNRQGPQVLETPGQGQRQRASLSLEREQAIVAEFLQPRAKGRVRPGHQLKPVVGQAIGRRVHKTTVYRMLRRQQWREIVPRPRHPQARAEEQAAFTKPSPRRGVPSCNPVRRRRRGRCSLWPQRKAAVGGGIARAGAGLPSRRAPLFPGKSSGSGSRSLPPSVRSEGS